MLVEALGHLHGPLGAEAQLAAGLLLQGRGHERGRRRAPVGFSVTDLHREAARRRARRPARSASASSSTTDLAARASSPVSAKSRPVATGVPSTATRLAAKDRAASSVAGASKVPSRSHQRGGAEPHPGPLALDDHAGGHALDPAGRQAGHDLLPQDRRDLVAVEPVEDPAGLLGVDQAAVEVAPLVDGPLDGRPR